MRGEHPRHIFHVRLSRAILMTRCGRRADAVPSLSRAMAADPIVWREGSALSKLLPGVAPAVCVECARRPTAPDPIPSNGTSGSGG